MTMQRKQSSEAPERNLWVMLPLISFMFAVACEARAADQEDAQKVVASAVRAVGGPDAIARYKARAWKEKAVYHGADGDESYEAPYVAAWPDKLRVEIGDFTLIVNGNKGWIKTNGHTREMTAKELEEHTEGTYSAWVLSLLPLRNKDFKLSRIAGTNVGGLETDGVNVSHRGHFDVQLYFDKKTALLAMSRTRYKEARSGREVKQETSFSNYKDVDGIKTPTKVSINRDGKRVVEATVETSYLAKVDDRTFAKP